MIDQRRRTLVTALSLIGPAMLGGAPARAAEVFPSRPLSVIVGFPPGGAADVVARIFAEPMSQHLGEHIVVENVAGATGIVAANRVLKSPADGYTLFNATTQEIIVVPMMNPAAAHAPKDFQLVAPMYETNVVLLARPGVPASSLDDFIDYARKSGKPLTFASSGTDSLFHLIGESMAKRLGVEFLHVPYAGATPALQGLGGGQVDFAILPYQRSMDALAEQGRFAFVTAFNTKLPASMKHLPLISQNATFADFVYSIPGGHYVRADTPEALVKVLRDAAAKTLADQGVRDRIESEGRFVFDPPRDGKQVEAYYAGQVESYRKLLTSIGRKPLL